MLCLLLALTAGGSDAAWINNAGEREGKVGMHKPEGKLDEGCPKALLPERKKVAR